MRERNGLSHGIGTVTPGFLCQALFLSKLLSQPVLRLLSAHAHDGEGQHVVVVAHVLWQVALYTSRHTRCETIDQYFQFEDDTDDGNVVNESNKDDDTDDDEPESLTAGNQATAGLSRRAQAQQPSPH